MEVEPTSVIAAVVSALGVISQVMDKFTRTNDIAACRVVSKKVVCREINDHLKRIINHFRGEVNRIMEIATRQSTTFGTIQEMDIAPLELTLNASYGKILDAHRFDSKLQSAASRVVVFRWLLIAMLLISIVLLGIHAVLPHLLPEWVASSLLYIVIALAVAVLVDFGLRSNLIDKVRSAYGPI